LFPDAHQTFETAFCEYITQIRDLEKGSPATDVLKNRQRQPILDLQMDDNGFPLIPDPLDDLKADSLIYQKHLIRSFITVHYSKVAIAVLLW